jgi:pimeloyl-ACP methyl ester carboxylesterase
MQVRTTRRPAHPLHHHRLRRSISVVALSTLTVAAAACGSSEPRAQETLPGDDVFQWERFGKSDRGQIGNLTVPLDYANPEAGTINLFVARHLADKPEQRIGTLLVNPGGPGFGGSALATNPEFYFSQTLIDRFDIVGWDPRGTGLSEPAIDCIDDYDRFFSTTDITPDNDAERQQAADIVEEFTESCIERSGDVLQFMGTNNSARDMNAIREALQVPTISYFGFSYGSELGATWATLFPKTVRAAVLDGAIDPNAESTVQSRQQSVGFESTLTTFLAQCSSDSACAFHNDGNAEAAFDTLMTSLDEQPIPSVKDRPDINRVVALWAVGQALYSDSLWNSLEAALSDAQKGDGKGLLELYDDYFERLADGTYDNALEAFQVISCIDDPERLDVAAEDAVALEIAKVAPRFAPNTVGSYMCTFFPEAEDPRIVVTGVGAGPVLVMGTTGDPATPLDSTRAMAASLDDGRLVIVNANQHTGYAANECSIDVVDNYLIDPVADAPADGTRCD